MRDFLKIFPARLREYHDLLTNNRLWIDRTQGHLRVCQPKRRLRLGCTGPTLRGSGVAYDVRKVFPYCGYERFDFDIPVGTNGDVYDRYLVRMLEMDQSLKIIQQALDGLPEGALAGRTIPRSSPPPKYEISSNMEALIHHFKLYTEGYRPPAGEVYLRTESPKGELGFYIVSDGSAKPYRMHVRAPSFANLQALPLMIEGLPTRRRGGRDRQHRHRAGRGGPLMISGGRQGHDARDRRALPQRRARPCCPACTSRRKPRATSRRRASPAVAEVVGAKHRRGRVGRHLLFDVSPGAAARTPSRSAPASRATCAAATSCSPTSKSGWASSGARPPPTAASPSRARSAWPRAAWRPCSR